MRASRNHLRAFTNRLPSVDLSYEPQYLDQEEFDTIVATPVEPGWGRQAFANFPANRGFGQGQFGLGRGQGRGLGQGQGQAKAKPACLTKEDLSFIGTQPQGCNAPLQAQPGLGSGTGTSIL